MVSPKYPSPNKTVPRQINDVASLNAKHLVARMVHFGLRQTRHLNVAPRTRHSWLAMGCTSVGDSGPAWPTMAACRVRRAAHRTAEQASLYGRLAHKAYGG
jgi:hypothetical protein